MGYALSLGIQFDSLRNYQKWKHHYIWRLKGGPAHNLLLLEEGVYYTRLRIHITGKPTDNHVVVVDLNYHKKRNRKDYFGMIIDNHGRVKLIEQSDRIWSGKPEIPPASSVFHSMFPGADRVSITNVYKLLIDKK